MTIARGFSLADRKTRDKTWTSCQALVCVRGRLGRGGEESTERQRSPEDEAEPDSHWQHYWADEGEQPILP